MRNIISARPIFTFSLCWCCLWSYAQTNNAISQNIISKLQAFSTVHIIEKAYLQFDKPYYAAGDTIYFKAYVTMGERHGLSTISNVLHVDLINTANKMDQTIKLQLDRGLDWGDFALPDSLPAGNYSIRAYTKWMRNDGETAFFYKTIPIGSSVNKIPESSTKPTTVYNKADIQFFPEGGSIVAGVRSKVAFKAIGRDGMGINVKGVITDNSNNTVCSLTSTHLGMGYFYLKPEDGKTYKARLTYADGTEGTVDLPAPNAKGIILSVNNDSIPQASVKIEASNNYYLQNKNSGYTLLISSGNTATTVKCKLDSPVITLTILKRRLHTGITTVTLFSSSGEPLCERLIFVQNYDQLKLDVNAGKNAYAKREKVNIKLNAANRAGNPAEGHFSVSVTNENLTPVDENTENTIVSDLLLTSDLKGNVEQPNYYFTDTSASAAKNLDILMLTQGYRHFTWKQVLDNKPLACRPEKGLEISGVVKNLFDKPIAGGAVNLIQPKGGPLLSSVTDDKGAFHFSNLIFNDTTHFVLSAVNAKGKNSTKINLFNEVPEPVIPAIQLQNMQTVSDTGMAAYLKNTKNDRNELINYGRGKGIILKEVKIKSTKIEPYKMTSYGIADQVISGDKILYGGSLSVRLSGLVHFHRHFPKPVLVIWNGVEMPRDFDIDVINTGSIKDIEVISNATANGPDYDNILIINTTFGEQVKDMVSTGILPIAPVGFYKAREFYSPKYDNTALTTKQRDLRSTIYWKPEITTDKDGNSSFDFYNADGTGTYRIVIEGIDDKGNLGSQVYRYKVE